MELELSYDDEFRVSPAIKKAVEKLQWKVSGQPDDKTIPMIVESTQLQTLRLIMRLLDDRNSAISANLSKLIEPFPTEVKTSFVNSTMKYGMI